MEIVISGTKFGWGYFTEKQPSGLFDIGSGVGIKALTQQAYAIGYKNNNCIFTKYRIIKDVRGDKRIGYIAFSLFLPFDKKLSGKLIKEVLDRVQQKYCQKYIPDGRNLEDVREDFSFLDTISEEYKKDIRSNSSVVSEDMQSGTTDAAVVYFPYMYKDIQTQQVTKFDLEDIFDAPFQEEYTPYRQVLFISRDLQGKDENPLVALHHSESDLTGKVDLKNEYYYLNSDNRSKGIYITANGKPRSDKKSENQIRAKWQVEIKYSKDDRYYEPINVQGTISDLSTEIHNYLEIDVVNHFIRLKDDAFNNPGKRKKSITFEIKDQNGKSLEGAEIQIGTKPLEKVNKSSTTINFLGEDIVKEWSVSAKKESESLYSSPVLVMPKNINDLVVLTLQKHKKIKFQGELKDGNDSQYLTDIKISIQAKNVFSQEPECDFVDDEINQPFKVTATYSNNREKLQGEKEFCPKDVKLVLIELKKSSQEEHKCYALDMGRYGIASAGYSNSETGNDISVKNITKEYVFKDFKLDKNNKRGSYDGTLVAQYEKQKSYVSKAKTFFSNPAVIATSIVSALVLGAGIWALCYFLGNYKQPKENPLTTQQITTYVEGDSLFLNTLNDYKENWKKQEQDFITKSGGGMFGGDENVDSTKWKNDWNPAYESIERAITKRNLINNKNFAELKMLSYSSVQQSFITAIEKIVSTKYTEVGEELGDVSALTLKQIAGKINEILKPKEPAKEETPVELKKEEKKPEQKKEKSEKTEQPKEQPKLQEQKSTQQGTVSSDKTSEIIQYIKGSELDEAKLKEYKNTKGINQNLKNSIQLCLDFWALDGSGSGKKAKTYWNFRDRVNEDNNFNNSKLKAFLDKMCNKNNPSYSKMDKKKGLK